MVSQKNAEEKATHKAMMQQMKDGYTSTRGNSGGASRGSKGWDALVAETKEERKKARQNGLLSDDDINSSDEEEDEEESDEEDEMALLDRILKERHNMGKKTVIEELGESEDEEEDIEEADDENDR